MVMMELKWINTARFCVAFPISSLGFTQTLQTLPGHPLCSVWPCLVVWLVSTSCPGWVAFTDQSVLEASIWATRERGGSCQCFPKSSLKPYHLHMDGCAISKGSVLGRGMGGMTCPLSPEIPGAESRLLGRVSGPPLPTWSLLCPAGWEIRLRRWCQWQFFGLQPPARVGEFGRETLEEVSVGIEPAPSTPCLACNDLSGNRSTSQVDELAAKHPAAGCSRPDWIPWVTCPCVADRGEHCYGRPCQSPGPQGSCLGGHSNVCEDQIRLSREVLEWVQSCHFKSKGKVADIRNISELKRN